MSLLLLLGDEEDLSALPTTDLSRAPVAGSPGNVVFGSSRSVVAAQTLDGVTQSAAVSAPAEPPTFVQAGSMVTGYGVSSVSPNITGATAGNLLVLEVTAVQGGGFLNAIAAPSGWSIGVNPASLAVQNYPPVMAVFYKIATAGTNSAVAAFTGGVAYASAQILEYSGIDAVNPLGPVDTNVSASLVTSATPGSVTTTVANSLVVAGMHPDNAGATTSGLGTPSGYTATLLNPDSSTFVTGSFGYKILSATGTESPTFSWSTASPFAAGIVVFNGLASGPPALSITAAQTMGSFTQSAAVTTSATVSAVAAQTLADFTQNAVATTQVQAAAVQAMAAFSQTSTVTHGGVSAIAAQVMDSFAQAATLSGRVAAVAAQTMASLTQSATVQSGVVDRSLAAAQTMGSFSQAVTVTALARAVVAQTMDAMNQAAALRAIASLSSSQTMENMAQAATVAAQHALAAAQAMDGMVQSALLVAFDTISYLSAAQMLGDLIQIARTQHEYIFEVNERTVFTPAQQRIAEVAAVQRMLDVMPAQRLIEVTPVNRLTELE